jgi:hypothetical protein
MNRLPLEHLIDLTNFPGFIDAGYFIVSTRTCLNLTGFNHLPGISTKRIHLWSRRDDDKQCPSDENAEK